MDLQQIGLRHPVAELIRDIQRNRTGIPRRTFVAEGLYENNMVLSTGVEIDAFVWCPEAAYSDEAVVRAPQLASRARRAYQVSGKTMERLAERPNPEASLEVERETPKQSLALTWPVELGGKRSDRKSVV